MTKELAVILVLTLVATLSLVGWFFFERTSVLTGVDYAQKTSEPLNPVLRLDVLQESIE